MASTRGNDRRARVWRAVFYIFLVAAAVYAVLFGEHLSFRLAIPTLVVALGVAMLAPRPGRARLEPAHPWRGGAALPRRLAYGLLASAAAALGAIGFALVSVAARQMDTGAYYRGAPAAGGLVFAVLLGAVALISLFGVASGRGRVHLDPGAVSYTPLAGRTKRAPWDDIARVEVIENGATLLVQRAYTRFHVPLAGQRWSGSMMADVIERYAEAGPGERAALTDPSSLEPWLTGDSDRPSRSSSD